MHAGPIVGCSSIVSPDRQILLLVQRTVTGMRSSTTFGKNATALTLSLPRLLEARLAHALLLLVLLPLATGTPAGRLINAADATKDRLEHVETRTACGTTVLRALGTSKAGLFRNISGAAVHRCTNSKRKQMAHKSFEHVDQRA